MAFNNNKGELLFPYDIIDVDPEINTELLRDFTGEKTGFVQVGPKKYFFPSKFREASYHLYNFQSRPSDVYVATFPRSGTTWTQELVWMIANDLNYDKATAEPLTKRFPFFEFCVFMHEQTKQELLLENQDSLEKQNFVELVSTPGYDFLPDITEQRFIKTHLPFSLLPPSVMECKSKVIYVARNPKDVAVSYYYLNKLYRTQGYINTFEKYWDYFEKNLNPWMPYWSHLKEGWEHRNHPNVLFMFYEDMNKDLPATIRKVANFLKKNLTDEEVTKLTSYLSIENFKHNTSVNQNELKEVRILNPNEEAFVRKGKTNLKGWQKEYTPEIIERVEKWMEINLKETDMRFPEY
ncbi:luciferin sulfotransferase-like [Bradysia coprophila]|uniref:luciferin sulfotransferase-like n=1 Tax=Bradysia coprophila TaxID=38358 RepID=UPI00187D6EB0|nr:luciferin sulfotransferase-like [Bradysia coprophila]